MNPEIEIRSGGIELIDSVGPLWERLKAHHLEIDTVYPDSIRKADFEKRKEELMQRDHHLVELAIPAGSDLAVGYCLTSVNERNVGELDSIFVDEPFRGCGIGKRLVRQSLEWMDAMNVGAKKVYVLEVNQEAVELYKEFGFKVRLLEMLIAD